MMNTSLYDFDVIVIGGGHAGIEAAYAAARMGSKTVLITITPEKIGLMPCNPAIGGIGKGHIVFEISALGGLMPKLCTKTYVQARMLNTKKGPAVQGLRLQIDSIAYQTLSKTMLEQTQNITILQGMVEDILVKSQSTTEKTKVLGIKTSDGITYHAPSVIIATGTFLNGRIHIGSLNYPAGRRDEPSATALSKKLADLGLQLGRVKTGTPPRLLRSSVDFSKLTRQEPHELHYLFEFAPHKVTHTQTCYSTATHEKTHEIIKNNIEKSALKNGGITTFGPRYCPSIEVKIERFSSKTFHHVFVEPVSASNEELYPNGLSNALPVEIQQQFINSIAGFEKAIITKPGYAIEYDFVFPNQLNHSLEVKHIDGLFLAGQINGTTGYEEAAGQGIIAGINAHLKAHKKAPFILSRHEAYIGVMIDDLVSLGIDEPYRMFTSRAERRLILRQDNVFYRLADTSYGLGLIDKELYDDIQTEKKTIDTTLESLRKNKHIEEIRKRNETREDTLAYLAYLTNYHLSERALLSLSAEIRYGPYIDREIKEVEKAQKFQELSIPPWFDYQNLPGLSTELQEKLIRYKPTTIAQATLIQGMTPAAISLLIFKVRETYEIKNQIIP